jgi:hypothetical protein
LQANEKGIVMPNAEKKAIGLVMHPDGSIEAVGVFPERSESEKAERKAYSAQCGHVKRRLLNKEPLTGELLELALSVIPDPASGELGRKLKAGQPLGDYELHLMVDMYLLHARLAGP